MDKKRSPAWLQEGKAARAGRRGRGGVSPGLKPEKVVELKPFHHSSYRRAFRCRKCGRMVYIVDDPGRTWYLLNPYTGEPHPYVCVKAPDPPPKKRPRPTHDELMLMSIGIKPKSLEAPAQEGKGSEEPRG